MIKPVPVLVEVPDKGKDFPGGKLLPDSRKFFPAQVAVKTVKRFKIRAFMDEKSMKLRNCRPRIHTR